MRVLTGSSLVSVLYFSLATPATAAPLQPAEKWNVDYGATQCTAARDFGDAANPITLGIVPSLSGTTYTLMVSEQQAGPHFAQEANGTVDFGRGPIRSEALYFGGSGVKMRAHQFRILAQELEQARSAASVSLKGVGGARFDFALSDMPGVLDALHKCTADLQRSWNVGGNSRTAQAPLGNISDLFTTNQLPPELIRKQQQDRAQYQLLVDEKGAVAACDVLVTSGSAMIDTIGCQLISGTARFKPAMDAAGQRVRSVWTSPRVTWRTNSEALSSGCRATTSGGADVSSCGQTPGQSIHTEMMSSTPP
jgi:hypothetical protein